MIDQLLAFSRKRELEIRTLDLNEVLTGFEGLLRRALHENITLRCGTHREPLFIRGDQGQLEQIIMNLAVNARDAMPEGGELTLHIHPLELSQQAALKYQLSEPGSYAGLRVQDCGCGIAPDLIEKIFDPFFTTKAVGAGTGLGLSTVFGLVQQHHGGICVESTPGKGTVFELAFPLSTVPEEPEAVEPPQPDTARPQGGEIWVAEDEAAVLQILKQGLAAPNRALRMFADPRDLLKAAQQTETAPDLLITDVIMPHLNGVKLSEELQKQFPACRVIYISGYSRDKLQTGTLPDDAVFLRKPFSLKKLNAIVNQLLSS
jgi:CheY-like chemotaxis protein